jgi:hypothetical protein
MRANFGTTVFSITTKDGITIGADNMARHHDGRVECFRKLHLIHGSVIACEGLGILDMVDKPETTDLVSYRADLWMAGIEADPRLELNANAERIVSFIETSHPFIELIRCEEVLHEFHKFQVDSGKGYLADFLVASASFGELLVVRTRARMTLVTQLDAAEWKIVFDRSIRHDGRPQTNPFVRHGAGKTAQIDSAFSGNGDHYQDMLIRTNGSFMRLLNGSEVSLDELRDIVRCAMSLEAEANPKQVGPPFVVATLQPRKPVSVTTYGE